MTLGGYWPPSSISKIADFGGGTNCASREGFCFYFSCVRGTKPLFFAYARENSPVQPLLVVLLLLPLSSAMDNGEHDHGGGGGSSGSLAAVAAAAVVAVDDDWR